MVVMAGAHPERHTGRWRGGGNHSGHATGTLGSHTHGHCGRRHQCAGLQIPDGGYIYTLRSCVTGILPQYSSRHWRCVTGLLPQHSSRHWRCVTGLLPQHSSRHWRCVTGLLPQHSSRHWRCVTGLLPQHSSRHWWCVTGLLPQHSSRQWRCDRTTTATDGVWPDYYRNTAADNDVGD